MARIRTIKPEFFTSADIVKLSFPARLLYVGLWCEADREGRLIWKPETFKLRYFPGDKVNIDALARELIASGLVIEYGNGLAYIPKFSQHQHVNPREIASKLPEPSTRHDASNPELHSVSTVQHAQGGREGKGKEGKELDVASGRDPHPPRINGHKSETRQQATEVLSFLNEKTGRNYEPVDAHLDMIVARLKEGATVVDMRQVVAKKCREWIGNPKMDEFLRPKTLFNRTNFANYKGELVNELP